jgi:hypothetical protein
MRLGKGAGDHKETVWVERTIGILMLSLGHPMQIRGEVRRVVEYRDKVKSKGPWLPVSRQRHEQAAGPIAQESSHRGIGNKKKHT